MMLADTIPTWQSTVSVLALIGTVASLLFAGLMVLYMKRQTELMAQAANKPVLQEITPQPLNVEVVKALHDQFADKVEFQTLVANNTKRHGELFNKLEKVEADARTALAHEISKINVDRQRTMEKLTDQFTFIRESLAGINTELKLKREDK